MATYIEYISGHIEDLRSLKALYRIYAPDHVKHRGIVNLDTSITLLSDLIKRVEEDKREEPF